MSRKVEGPSGRPDEWVWSYDPDYAGAPAYRRHACPITPHTAATASSRGAIMLHAPGYGDERWHEMKRLLIAKYDPAYIVPPMPQVLAAKGYGGSRDGGHNSTWYDKGFKL